MTNDSYTGGAKFLAGYRLDVIMHPESDTDEGSSKVVKTSGLSSLSDLIMCWIKNMFMIHS